MSNFVRVRIEITLVLPSEELLEYDLKDLEDLSDILSIASDTGLHHDVKPGLPEEITDEEAQEGSVYQDVEDLLSYFGIDEESDDGTESE